MEFEEFVRPRLRGWLGLLTAMSGDAALAEDLVQDVLIRLHAQWPRISAVAHPGGYAHRMLTNAYLSHGRKWGRIEPRADPVEGMSAADEIGRVDERDALLRALADLPRQQRAVLALRYYADLDDVEIAEALSCRASTVRSNAARGLAALRSAAPAAPYDHETRNR